MRKFFSTLRSRIILIIILTSIPSLLFLIETRIEQHNQAIEAVQEEVVHLGHVASNMQSVLVDNVESFLITLAHLPTIREMDMENCQGSFAHLVAEHFAYYASFYVADLQGNILCSPPNVHAPPNFDNCDHYANLVKATDFVFSGYHICQHTGEAVLSIGYPIHDDQGKTVLVSNVSLDLVWFYDFARDSDLPEGAELILLDEQGVILLHYPDNDKWRGYTLPEYTVLNQLFAQKEGSLIGTGLDQKETVYAISTMEDTTDKITVAMGIPTAIAFAEANKVLTRNIIILLVVMAVVILLVWLLGDSLIVKQTQSLVKATQRLAGGDLKTRSGVNYDIGELGQLAEAFDQMADQISQREIERNQHEAALSEYAQDLEESNQELRNFVNIASHDLQEPLRKIQTFGELLEERHAEQLDEQGTDYIDRMRNAANRMQTLLAELLTYSRVTTKASPFSYVDLNQTINQVLSDLDLQIEESQAEIEIEELPRLQADPTQMQQLFMNLVSNALKFHKAGKPPQVHISSNHSEDGICEIQVADKGVGFDEKYLDRIFQPFQRLHHRQAYNGTGMGLAICRKIVDRHNGTIDAHSQVGVGTTFTVRLPKKQPVEKQGA